MFKIGQAISSNIGTVQIARLVLGAPCERSSTINYGITRFRQQRTATTQQLQSLRGRDEVLQLYFLLPREDMDSFHCGLSGLSSRYFLRRIIQRAPYGCSDLFCLQTTRSPRNCKGRRTRKSRSRRLLSPAPHGIAPKRRPQHAEQFTNAILGHYRCCNPANTLKILVPTR